MLQVMVDVQPTTYPSTSPHQLENDVDEQPHNRGRPSQGTGEGIGIQGPQVAAMNQ